MKKFNLLFFLILGLASFSQDLHDAITIKNPIPGDNIIASPEVAAFHEYNFLPTNLYTGTVDIEIPIFNIQSGNISLPIALKYNAHGVRVDDYAPNTGMGWTLNASGSLVKVIKDIEDFDYSIGSWSEPDPDFGIITESYLSSVGSKIDCQSFGSCHNPYSELPTFYNQGCFDLASGTCSTSISQDASPDLFIANAPGFSSKFIMQSGTNGTFTPIELSPSGVDFQSVSRTKDYITNYIGFYRSELQGISQLPGNWKIGHLLDSEGNSYAEDYDTFSMYSPYGLKYSFGEHSDITESISTSSPGIFYNSGSGNELVEEAKSLEIDFYKITKNTWHLDKIEDPLTDKTVDFEYEQYSNENKQVSKSYFEDTYPGGIGQNGATDYLLANIPNYFTYPNPPRVDEYFTKRQKSYSKYPRLNRIKKILFDEGEVEFYYDFNRQDIPNQKALSKVIVRNNLGQTVKHMEFEYSYFYSISGCTQGDCVRLKLDKVINKDNTGVFVNEFEFEYYNPNDLPEVKSFEQDFLGYYNANGVNSGTNGGLVVPKLYFHENQGRFSILPFPLSNQSSQTIITSGSYSIIPNATKGHYGSLKKISYPTGGYSIFEYEPNYFRLLGADYIAGGIRIKSQKLYEGSGDPYIKNYSYETESGLSSGAINNMPVYGAILTHNPTSNQNSFVVYGKSRSSLELTSGSFVGYSRVIEEQEDFNGNSLGYTEYQYSNPDEYPNEYSTLVNSIGVFNENIDAYTNYLMNNSNFPYVGYVDNDIRRGKMKLKQVFNKNNDLIYKVENQYTYRTFTNQEIQLDFSKSINQYWGTQGTYPDNIYLSFNSKINIEHDLLTQIVNTETFYGENKITQTNYTYDSQVPLLKESITNDGVDNFKKNIYYAQDSEVANLPYISNIVNEKRSHEPVRIENRINNSLVSTEQTNYDNFTNNLFLPKSTSFAKANELLEENSIISLRDHKGNVLQFKTRDGVDHCIIWGYNYSLPIARIENLKYTDLPSSLLQQIIIAANTSNESNLLIQLDNLRNHAALGDAKMISYSHKPQVGISTMTDTRGYRTTYLYDDFNRLIEIRDADNNILEKHNYNYANN